MRTIAVLALSVQAALSFQATPTYLLDTVFGAGPPADVEAVQWHFGQTIYRMTTDRQGNLWFLEGNSPRKLTRDGRLHGIDYTLILESVCDLSPAVRPQVSLAVGPDGLLYIGDPYCKVIRRVRMDGKAEVFAGRLGGGGPSGNGGPALGAGLEMVGGMAFDTAGNLYFVEWDKHTLRKIDTKGIVTLVASSQSGAPLSNPVAVAIDPKGDIVIAEGLGSRRVVKFTPAGVPSVVHPGVLPYLLDMAVDGAGNIYLDRGSGGPLLARISSDGGLVDIPKTAHWGGFAVDAGGVVFFADPQSVIYSADQKGTVKTIAGGGANAREAGVAKYAAPAATDQVNGTAMDPAQALWVVAGKQMDKIEPSGKLVPLLSGLNGARDPAFDSTASLWYLNDWSIWKLDSAQNGKAVRVVGTGRDFSHFYTGLAIDAEDNVYVGESSYQGPAATANIGARILRLSARTLARTYIAGTGAPGYSGDGGAATAAKIGYPYALAVDAAGNVYIADLQNHVVRKVGADGGISTVAGTGGEGAGPDGVAAASIRLSTPTGVAVDALGNVYISEGRRLIRIVDRQGIIRTIAGGGLELGTEDGTLAADARLLGPRHLFATAEGLVYFVDGRSVRRLTPVTTEFPRVLARGVVHAASYQTGAVAPGMIATLFGANIGPQSLAQAAVANGRLVTQLGGTRVLFDGVPAPMVYAISGQVSAIVPYAVASKARTAVVVDRGGARSLPVSVEVAAARPGFFTADSSGSGRGAFLNQDGSLNTPANPAAAGSIVVLFGTGEGQTTPAGVDGLLAASALPKPQLLVSLTICGEPAEVLYGGAAPGATAGLLQVNARVPARCAGKGDVAVELQVGAFRGPSTVTLAVQ